MIAELGHFALALALVLAIVQSVVPLYGASRGEPALMALGGSTAIGQFALVTLAFVALAHAYVTSDFSLATVAENSHSTKPLLYKITGVWSNHEGSMVLWVLILTLFGAAVAWFGTGLPPDLRARVLAVQGMIGAGFFAFILFTSNPFLRLVPAPLDGQGMNPILQDLGLAIHPPFLYLGYVGFSVSFSFAVAALIEGRVDAAWARWVRPWTLAAWCALTVGIALGSWWAYYTLGWGGWWYWDPVENASFMPWLVGTALLHSAIVVEKRDALKTWTILLAIVTFGLSLIGTFLVRSGVLTSVHAFAVDPARGAFILLLLVIAIGGPLVLYAVRAPSLRGGGIFAPISREGALVLNNLLLATGAATVFIGTLYPLFLDAMGGDKVSVGFPFFNRTFVPLMVPLLIAMPFGPLLGWKRGDLLAASQRLLFAAGAAIAVVLAVLLVVHPAVVLATLGLGLAAWIGAGSLIEWSERVQLFRGSLKDSLARARHLPRAAYGVTLAHLGVAVTVAGIAASAWESERIDLVHPGDSVAIAGYDLRLDKVEPATGPNYTADRATVTVTRNGALVTVMHPEKRLFTVQQMPTTFTAIRTDLLSDLYVVLADGDGKGAWTLRVYQKPLVPWIWLGCGVMALGGLMSLSDRRWRVGAAVPRSRAPAGAAADD
ncbi:MAG TPA: heme lyase CcmF/NrfE family subunit [Stellaceae bacterium]|jgi:cytochrome c-type biogenesis protein CcmF|nr:heme lyase CcmF/NrfE family subunit [Stellaceae bacterium]